MICHCEIESVRILFEFKTHEEKEWWPSVCDVLIFSKFESADSKLLEISSQNADLFKKTIIQGKGHLLDKFSNFFEKKIEISIESSISVTRNFSNSFMQVFSLILVKKVRKLTLYLFPHLFFKFWRTLQLKSLESVVTHISQITLLQENND